MSAKNSKYQPALLRATNKHGSGTCLSGEGPAGVGVEGEMRAGVGAQEKELAGLGLQGEGRAHGHAGVDECVSGRVKLESDVGDREEGFGVKRSQMKRGEREDVTVRCRSGERGKVGDRGEVDGVKSKKGKMGSGSLERNEGPEVRLKCIWGVRDNVSNGDKFKLLLPSTKQPGDFSNCELGTLYVEKVGNERVLNDFIAEAVFKNNSKAEQGGKEVDWKTLSCHTNPAPNVFNSVCWQRKMGLQGALIHLQKKHPFPLNQGPLVLPLDDHFLGEKISTSEVFEKKMIFKHDENQECFEWIPSEVGINAWNDGEEFILKKPSFSPQGPVSTKKMEIVYSCNLEKCIIRCPCSVCNDDRETCKLFCKDEVCNMCNSQCINHKINLPRLFNPETDQFTLVSGKLGFYKYAIPYSGVPVSCEQCTKDVLEHQNFHLVFHKRCRFCRDLLRPFERRNIIELEDYEQATKILKWSEDRTCSYCLAQSSNEAKRIRHEKTLHQNNGGYQCGSCNKNYSNTTSLNYHILNNHTNKDETDVDEFQCEFCLEVLSTVQSLQRHVKSFHLKTTRFKCEQCEETFVRKDSLTCHLREQHFNINANVDFVEDLGNYFQNKCDQCDKSFKRKYQLKRHVSTVHSSAEYKKKFQCPKCDKKFTTKDHLKRHEKSKHSDE